MILLHFIYIFNYHFHHIFGPKNDWCHQFGVQGWNIVWDDYKLWRSFRTQVLQSARFDSWWGQIFWVIISTDLCPTPESHGLDYMWSLSIVSSSNYQTITDQKDLYICFFTHWRLQNGTTVTHHLYSQSRGSQLWDMREKRASLQNSLRNHWN
jgi:hypothetical protein